MPWHAIPWRAMPWRAIACHGMRWHAVACQGMPWHAMAPIHPRININFMFRFGLGINVIPACWKYNSYLRLCIRGTTSAHKGEEQDCIVVVSRFLWRVGVTRSRRRCRFERTPRPEPLATRKQSCANSSTLWAQVLGTSLKGQSKRMAIGYSLATVILAWVHLNGAMSHCVNSSL